jgi:hypothetical protein
VTVVHDRGEEPRGRIIIARGMISSSNVSSFRAVTSTVAICNVRFTSTPVISGGGIFDLGDDSPGLLRVQSTMGAHQIPGSVPT